MHCAAHRPGHDPDLFAARMGADPFGVGRAAGQVGVRRAGQEEPLQAQRHTGDRLRPGDPVQRLAEVGAAGEAVLLDRREVTGLRFESAGEVLGELRFGGDQLGGRHQGEQPGGLVPAGRRDVPLDVHQAGDQGGRVSHRWAPPRCFLRR